MKIYYLIEKKGKKRQMLPCAYAECIEDALDYTKQNSGVFCIVRVKEVEVLKIMENYCIQPISGKEVVE